MVYFKLKSRARHLTASKVKKEDTPDGLQAKNKQGIDQAFETGENIGKGLARHGCHQAEETTVQYCNDAHFLVGRD